MADGVIQVQGNDGEWTEIGTTEVEFSPSEFTPDEPFGERFNALSETVTTKSWSANLIFEMVDKAGYPRFLRIMKQAIARYDRLYKQVNRAEYHRRTKHRNRR